uniref:Uncharacterized protein n=1 Tax=Percolomonas cosmopolitus TaxID=63605 RepID=A0A7S1PH78_9EUKA|mmetsp:Transcript_11625/g.43674  ORF Transcript_11625/g.43674 Transcript_11625/m.43674 type:complete len:400 (+) Transcript_11625:190-1389(+)|eukprot:CAMPEP_0117450134 /NCGR_PEP_ID=MMETSP0759-20121206/8307_1 /TAXON_ID=63605 /ORGANISM="Percolomonas cosmopolitus, Strain WS" /LENGTH=399 /DNA_ID=CAMNT_0005242637 /DNA_START=127 /DNA_END=1326 /DNA_ORIENTATION=-
MSLLSHLKSNTYFPPVGNGPTQLSAIDGAHLSALNFAGGTHLQGHPTDSNHLPIHHPVPSIPPHPTIAFTPKTPHLLNAAPRKKRITYKSQDEKKEALRERSRDNRRRAKERKDYMDRRIAWLEYENECVREILERKTMCLDEVKRQLTRGVTVNRDDGDPVMIQLNWQDLPFYKQGGAEYLFSALNLEKVLFGEPADDYSEDNASSASPVKTKETKRKSSMPTTSQQASNGMRRSSKSTTSGTSSTNSLSSFEEEEFDMEHEEDDAIEESRGVQGSSKAHSDAPLRLTRAQKRKREEAQMETSGDDVYSKRQRKVRATERLVALDLEDQQQAEQHQQEQHQQEQLMAFRQQHQFLQSRQNQIHLQSPPYHPNMSIYDALKANPNRSLEQNNNSRLFIL